ncbi:MBL fold metallo-hydrolase [Desulfatiferula olefinivorans]
MTLPFDVIHLGGETTVTGSSHLMLLPHGVTIMVDCGSAMGDDRATPLSDMPVKASAIDYLLITHAHIDHIGRIPELIEAGFCGEILCTHGTKALLGPMLDDGLSFSDRPEKDRQRLMKAIDDLSWGFEYNETFALKKGITFTFGHAGHILGSCFIRFGFTRPDGDPFSAVFSGDLGNIDTPLLPDPDTPDACDLLVLESTYGDRLHPDRTHRTEALGAILNKALADGGKVFIPAFALGRTQELIYEIDRLKSDRSIDPDIPVFIDTPLGLEITHIYASLKECWDNEARNLLRRGDHPLEFENLYAVENHHHHRKLLDLPGPAVIIAGSGMLTGGRILSHLERNLDDARNDVLFVGYQAKGTPGRALLETAHTPNGRIRLDGQTVPVNAGIHVLAGFSAHADQSGLVRFVESMPEKPGAIKLVHGEDKARDALKSVLCAKGHHVV